MSNPILNIPIKLPNTYSDSIPIINDNFDKVIANISDLAPRQFSTSTTGARPNNNGQLAVVALAYDQPEYTNFSTLTPQYDVFIDSGTNATGTLTIDNTASGSTATVSLGDYFVIPSEVTDQPVKPHIYIATSTASILAGASGSCNVIAERAGSDYNIGVPALSPAPAVPVQVYTDFGQAFPTYYTGGEGASVKIRNVSLTPTYGGSGGGSLTSYYVLATGGAGIENDPNYLFPNGASLSAAQKRMIVQHHLNITTATPNFSQSTTAPYTKNFATSTIRVINEDSVGHSVYVSVTGTIFSGITGNIFK